MKKNDRIKYNFTKLIKRHKYLVNLLVLLLGLIFVLIGILPQNIDPKLSDIFMNIGISIMSSSIIALLTLLMLTQNEDSENIYEKWGIESIYQTRSEMNSHTAQVFPKMNSKYEQIAFGVKSLRDAYSPLFEEKVKKGLIVRFITIHPNSEFLKERELVEKKQIGEIRKTIIDLLEWIRKLQKISRKPSNIQIKFYDSLPLDFYCRIDDDLYIGPYLYGKESQQTISYRYNCLGEGFKYYTRYFDDLWNNETFLKRQEQVEIELNANNENN